MENAYTATSGKLARESGTTVQTIVRYANVGLLEFIRSSDGTRLFREGQSIHVRRILAENLANRGRRPKAA